MGNKFPRILCSFLLLQPFFLIGSLASASPSNTSNVLTINNTTDLSIPDPNDFPTGFTIKVLDFGHSLRDIALFVNTVNLLGELAMGNMQEPVSQPKLYRYSDYPDVYFGLIPLVGGSTERRFFLYGLATIIFAMIREKTYHEGRVSLFWQEEIVGHIYIRYQSPPSSTLSANMPDETRNLDAGDESTLSPSSVSNGSIVPASNGLMNDPTFRVGMKFTGATVPISDVFLIVMRALVKFAGPESTDIISEQIGFRTIALKLSVLFQPSPRTRPPYFRYRHAIMALVDAPQFMMKAKKFGELEMELEVGHSLVAHGFIFTDSSPSIDMIVGSNSTAIS